MHAHLAHCLQLTPYGVTVLPDVLRPWLVFGCCAERAAFVAGCGAGTYGHRGQHPICYDLSLHHIPTV